VDADRRLLRALQALVGRSPALASLLRMAARCGSYAEIAIWLSLLPGGRNAWSRRLAWIRTGVALGLVSVIVLTFRRIVPRARPFASGDAHALVPREAGPSFPSRHVASAVCMTVLVGSVAPRRGLAMGLIAVAMALARIACGLHYPTDVLAGGAVGAAVAWIVNVGAGGMTPARTNETARSSNTARE
jgi:undecaprenyl-diphosphatase